MTDYGETCRRKGSKCNGRIRRPGKDEKGKFERERRIVIIIVKDKNSKN